MTNPYANMIYIEQDPEEEAFNHAASKYYGDVAKGYDDKRESSQKWKEEQEIIEDMLSKVTEGSWVLDIPCGTGRFFDVYAKRRLMVRAADISTDMLEIASKKAKDTRYIQLFQGNVLNLDGLDDKCNDVAVMVRLTRYLTPAQCQIALVNLMRVTRQKIIFTARYEHRNPQLARPLELFTQVMDGWKVSHDISLPGDEHYHVVEIIPDD